MTAPTIEMPGAATDPSSPEDVQMTRHQVLRVGVVLAIWSVVTPFMWRDLRSRSPEQVRGPNWLWWLLSSNLSGSAAYWLVGRRKDSDVD